MDLLGSILPNVLRRGAFGRKLREVETQDLFTEQLDLVLPGDVRSLVQVVSVEGSVATLASLSGFATRELKRQEGYILAKVNEKIVGKKILRIRYLA